jgi:hypothetical protein
MHRLYLCCSDPRCQLKRLTLEWLRNYGLEAGFGTDDGKPYLEFGEPDHDLEHFHIELERRAAYSRTS